MKKLLITLAALLSLTMGFFAHAQNAEAPKHHVVFPLDAAEGPEWGMLIGHVTNLRAALADEGGSEVEIVFYGPGLAMILKSDTEYAGALQKLADEGVIMAACQNAMRHMKVTSADLMPFAKEVDSGVAELARKQEQGWAYIK